jgi:hypothetical protein
MRAPPASALSCQGSAVNWRCPRPDKEPSCRTQGSAIATPARLWRSKTLTRNGQPQRLAASQLPRNADSTARRCARPILLLK